MYNLQAIRNFIKIKVIDLIKRLNLFTKFILERTIMTIII